jgi:hypothetical protein
MDFYVIGLGEKVKKSVCFDGENGFSVHIE